MAKDFGKSLQYEKLGARILAPVYELFERPLNRKLYKEGVVPDKSDKRYGANGRLYDTSHRFRSRDLQRAGVDYVFAFNEASVHYKFADEKADSYHKTGNFSLEELKLTAADLVPTTLHTARAGFLVYVFPGSLDIYFIPLEAARNFVEANRPRFTTTSVGNPTYLTFCTLVPIVELMTAIPSIVHIRANWFTDYEALGKKRKPKTFFPKDFAHRSLHLEDLPKALIAMPASREARIPSISLTVLLRHMTIKDIQRFNNAGHYAKLGLLYLVQDLLPVNRFELPAMSGEELACSAVQAAIDDGLEPPETAVEVDEPQP